MKRQGEHIRILTAIPGFDGHNRGVLTVTMALRDAGMEVIYVGNQSPEAIVEIAVQEGVDVVGLSIFAAGYMKLIPKVAAGLREKGAEDISVIVGGIIRPDDIAELKETGVAEVFLPGGRTDV